MKKIKKANPSSPSPSSSSSSSAKLSWCVRWAVSNPEPVSRHDIELLWAKGKVTGMFNLTTREQFEACQDFCIELGPGHGTRDSVVELRAQVAKLSEENLILSENLENIRKKYREEKRQLQQLRTFESREKALNAKIRELTDTVADMEVAIQELKEDLKSERITVRELVSERSLLEKKLKNERTFRKKLDAVGGRSWLIPDYCTLRRSLIDDEDDDDNDDKDENNNGDSVSYDNMYEVQPPDTRRFAMNSSANPLFPFISLQKTLKQLDDESLPSNNNNDEKSKSDDGDETYFTLFSSSDLL